MIDKITLTDFSLTEHSIELVIFIESVYSVKTEQENLDFFKLHYPVTKENIFSLITSFNHKRKTIRSFNEKFLFCQNISEEYKDIDPEEFYHKVIDIVQ